MKRILLFSKTNQISIVSILVVTGVLFLFIFNKNKTNITEKEVFRIGYTNSPLLSTMYYSKNKLEKNNKIIFEKFSSSADIGYALLSGKIGAGFVEPSKALIAKRFPEFKHIGVVGKITYPYGGILLVRKGLDLKMQNLEGYQIAASDENCRIFQAFKKDLGMIGKDVTKINIQFMPYETMISALESGFVDAALTKSSFGLLSGKLGFTIPYIQWDIAAGDKCCPAVVAQTEYLLLVNKKFRKCSTVLINEMMANEKVPPESLAVTTSFETGISSNQLLTLPPASFSSADMSLLQLFEGHGTLDIKEHESSEDDNERIKMMISLQKATF